MNSGIFKISLIFHKQNIFFEFPWEFEMRFFVARPMSRIFQKVFNLSAKSVIPKSHMHLNKINEKILKKLGKIADVLGKKVDILSHGKLRKLGSFRIFQVFF